MQVVTLIVRGARMVVEKIRKILVPSSILIPFTVASCIIPVLGDNVMYVTTNIHEE